MITKINRILFATTLEQETRAVTRMAAGLALQHQAELIMVHALDPLSAYS